MPRMGRLHLSQGLFHVLGRGLERRKIFRTDADKNDFLARLDRGLQRTGHECYAWALMDNHYHLLLRQSSCGLSELMGPLLGGYALNFNRRYKRSGYLYQGRYRSILCEEESYFLELLRYIHLNPVKARMIVGVEALKHYPWTGHSVILGKKKCSWQNTSTVLERFGGNQYHARQRYHGFVADHEGTKQLFDYSGGGLIRSSGGKDQLVALRKEKNVRLSDERILGSSDFVAQVLKQSEQMEFDDCFDLSIEKLVIGICAYYGIPSTEISHRARGNERSKARSLVAYIANKKLRLSTTDIALYLRMSHQGVSKAVIRGRIIFETEGVSLSALGC